MAEPTLVWQAPEGFSGNGTSWVFDWGDGAGEAAGDVALIFTYKESTAVVTPPAGWTLEDTWDQSTGGFKYRAAIYSHVLAGGETGAITFSWTGSTWRGAVMAVFRNPISSGFLLSATEDIEAAQNTDPSHPGITIQRSTSGVFFAVWNFDGGASLTAPAGFSQFDNDPGGAAGELHVAYDITSVATGATGTLAGTLTGGAGPEYPSSWVAELATVAAATDPFPAGRVRPGLSSTVRRAA